MAITTGNESGKRPILRISSEADSDGANVLLITDLTFSGDNNLATYNTIDSLSTRNFATTSSREISVTFLRDDDVMTNLEALFDNKTEANFELSPLGTDTGQPKKTGAGFITNLSENKTGTNIWEISMTFAINGDVTSALHT
jgi:hypothetical protein